MPEPHPYHQWIDLAQPRFGSEVVYATDEFFADKSRLLSPSEPEFIAGKYDANGKWMDGWESRRKRTPGHDHCVIRLGLPGIVHGVDIDTRHFTGNYPPGASLEACHFDGAIPDADCEWHSLLNKVNLAGNSQHFHDINSSEVWTHLRLNIFPDGGVARLRVFGEIRRNWSGASASGSIDLFALENGGRALQCNDEHFGSMHNLNVPGRGVNMGDGWETARRRRPGNDWVVVALGHVGSITEVEIDTAHFKGNYPDRVMLRAGVVDPESTAELSEASLTWPVLLPETPLQMDLQHHFTTQLNACNRATHVRMDILPDGGVSRLRLLGHWVED